MKRKLVYIDNFLTKHGHTPTMGDNLSTLLKEEEYHVIRTSSKRIKLIRLFDMLYTIVSNRKDSIVLISTYSGEAFYFAYISSLFCRFYKIPYITCLHGGNLMHRIESSKRLSAGLFGKSYVNVAVSGYLESYMQQNKWPVIIIPNNIHVDEYSFLLRKSSSPKLFWVRSFHEIYNPELAIRTLHLLKKTFPDIQLTMVGPDKDGSLAKCQSLAKELGVDNSVLYLGLLPRDEWIRISVNYDVFISTSNIDNLPVSVIEAMALGFPIVSTNVGGLKYLIQNNSNGLLVEPSDPQKFSDAVASILTNPQLAQSLSANARSTAQKYDWSVIKKQWHELLDAI